jgi:hypothetical protein
MLVVAPIVDLKTLEIVDFFFDQMSDDLVVNFGVAGGSNRLWYYSGIPLFWVGPIE